MAEKSKRPDTDDQDQFDLDEEHLDDEGSDDPEFQDMPYDQELDFNEKQRPSLMELYDVEYPEK